MELQKTSLKTLVGLPVVLLLAVGIAFGATQLHDSLLSQSPATLTADETVENTNQENLNTAPVNTTTAPTEDADEYDFLHQELVRQLETMWSVSTVTHAEVARQAIAGLCWLSTEPTASISFPAGRVREEWELMTDLLIEGNGPTTVCPAVPSAEISTVATQLQSDQDGDTLNDVAERWYGTSVTSRDTDGDGFSDPEEITNGYSPLVAGQSS